MTRWAMNPDARARAEATLRTRRDAAAMQHLAAGVRDALDGRSRSVFIWPCSYRWRDGALLGVCGYALPADDDAEGWAAVRAKDRELADFQADVYRRTGGAHGWLTSDGS